MSAKAVYLPGLNGLRAIAAIMVVIGHVIPECTKTYNWTFYYPFPMVNFAVTIFFVISGFLITYLLLIEKSKTEINIKHFYVRRLLRIWPLYYLYIGLCICFAFWGTNFQEVLGSHIYWYLFFVANISFLFNQSIGILNHLWSLAVEEQFYAFWPWVMKIKVDKIIRLITVSIITLCALKMIDYLLNGNDSIIYGIISTTRFHTMMLGALGAILFYNKNGLFIKISSNKFVQTFSWISLVIVGLDLIHAPKIISHELIAVISLLIIIGQITVENRVINLENNLCNFLGKISYGIYVIHPLCMFLLLPLLKSLPITVLSKSLLGLGIVLIVTVILAHISYNYYESFFLRLKNRYTTIKTQASDLQVLDKEYAIQ